MGDVEGLYIVTGVVLVALFGWVALVLVRAPDAVDLSKMAAPPSPPTPAAAGGSTPRLEASSTDPMAAPASRDELAQPASSANGGSAEPTLESSADSKPMASSRSPAVVVTSAPVPTPERSYLDSHPEIQDSPAPPTSIVMPPAADGMLGGGTGTKGGDALVLVTSVGLGDPVPGRSPERHAVVDRHHLLTFADGGGKKARGELASAIVVDALLESFETDEAPDVGDDPKLSPRANRVRRAVLAANRRVLRLARESGHAGMGTSVLAAYFSPKHRELFVAHVGASRAYCFRDGHLTRLTTPHGARTLGVVDRVEVEVVEEAVRPHDLYLFCSDAVGRAFGESDLHTWVSADPSLAGLARRLVEAASGTENVHNLVAILVRVEPVKAGVDSRGRVTKTMCGLG